MHRAGANFAPLVGAYAKRTIFPEALAGVLERHQRVGCVYSRASWPCAASSVSARLKGPGRSRPRFSARRRMPAAAFGLKKNLGGTSRVSKTADNEHTAASLGHAEVLSVEHPPGVPIPEFSQRPKDGSEVSPAVTRQKARDVLEENPTGSALSSEASELEEQSAPSSSQASTLSSHAEVLAGEPSSEKVNCSNVLTLHRRDVAQQPRLGEPLAQHLAGERLDLDLRRRVDAAPSRRQVEAADTGEGRSHHHPT